MIFVPKDVILLPESTSKYPNRWVAMNVFARTCLGVDDKVVRLLGQLPIRAVESGPFQCWDIERFSNEDGLLADPTRYVRDPSRWTNLQLEWDELLSKLKAHFIVIDNEAAYRARFQAKRHLLDKDHFGNFHQQHGQHMMLVKRVNPAKWWMEQKFSPDGLSVREDTLYGAVQWRFLERYFADHIKPGMTVIDLGCGNGVYTNAMARHGAKVLGVDPSDEYLAVAKANAIEGASFEKMQIGEVGGLNVIETASADVVFMSDALLFYYVPLYPEQKADIKVLLTDIRRLLKPGGKFVSLEPHSAFYLAPWLGSAEWPFTVVTEYLSKWHGIVPPLSWWMRKFADAGFAIADVREIVPADYFSEVDPRGYHFAKEFPLWQMLELIIRP
ncbi:MAG TPA: methyltransferase domain-containing protein [Pseudolabrys sp.]|nr:methyltransferase domain-containing protein [Pseudolabrys sp.]